MNQCRSGFSREWFFASSFERLSLSRHSELISESMGLLYSMIHELES